MMMDTLLAAGTRLADALLAENEALERIAADRNHRVFRHGPPM